MYSKNTTINLEMYKYNGLVFLLHKMGATLFQTRGGFGSGGSGIGQIRCPSVENKLTDNPSANRPLIVSGGRVG